jgi:uncharacterized repeat protein (TIGR01451 family)
MKPLNSLKPQRKSRMADRLPNLIQSLTGFRLQLVSVPALGLIAGLTLLGEAPAYGQVAGDIQVLTEFTPIVIDQGGASTLKLTITNNKTTSFGNVSLDQLLPPGMKLGGTTSSQNTCAFGLDLTDPTTLEITNGNLPPGDCILEVPIVGTRMQATAGDALLNFTIPINGFKAGSGGNSAISSGTITVRQLGNIAHSMTFAPTPIPGGGRTKFTMSIPNGTGKQLTGVTFTNGFTIPAGFTLAAGTTTNSCGGALTITGTPLQIKLTGGTIPATGCEFSFEMVGPLIENTYGPVTWAAGDLVTDLEVSNNAGESNKVNVEAGLKITQRFLRKQENSNALEFADKVYINEPATLEITIRNASATAIANADLQSIITGLKRDQLKLTGGTGNLGGTCTPASVNYTPATGTLAFTGVDLPAAILTPAADVKLQTCTITVQVESDNQGIGNYTSTIANTQLLNQVANTLNANLEIIDLEVADGNGLGLGFSFGPGIAGPFGSYEVAASNRGLMRITLKNLAGADLTNVGIGKTGIQLDTGMQLAKTGIVSNTCGGTVTAPAGPGPLTLVGGSITRRDSCYIDVEVVSDKSKLATGYGASAAAGVVSTAAVTGQASRTYTNATSGTAGPGPNNYLEVTDYLNIDASMATAVTALRADARVKLRLRNAKDQARSQLQLRYKLPFKLAIVPDFEAGPSCGVAPANFRVVEDNTSPSGFSLELDNLMIPAKGTSTTLLGDGQDGICDIAFDVEAPENPGSFPVPVPDGTLRTIDGSDQNRTREETTFNVVALNLKLDETIINEEIEDSAKETAAKVLGGEPAVLTVTLTNPGNPVPLTNITLNTVLSSPDAIIYPGAVATTTCQGAGGVPATVILNEATRTFGLTGANLTSGQSCTLKFPITKFNVEQLRNTIPAAAAVSAEGAKSNEANAEIAIGANFGLFKTITPSEVNAGESARLKLTIFNVTTDSPTDVKLTDSFPAGLVIASEPNLVTQGCSETAISAPAEGNVLQIRNGSVNPNSTCTIFVDVTSLTPRNSPYVNTINIGDLTALNGSRSNIKKTEAKLLVTGTTVQRPGLRLVKRATALTPARATAPIDLTPISVDDSGSFDNAPGWPGTLTPAGISNYLKGATDTAQLDLPGKQSLTSGTEVEYSGYYLSNGTVGTNNTKLCDFIPANTTYVPGSLALAKGIATVTTALSDTVTGAGDDRIGFLPASSASFPAACKGPNNGKGAVVVNVGNLTTTAPDSYGYFKFKVKID